MTISNDGHHGQPVDQPSPDLTHLHPDNVRLGSVGVFAGDWAWTGTPPRISVGVLVDHWNGWAVWRCTREVAEAVAADQQRMRALERTRLAGQGLTGADLDRRVDANVAPVFFDGDDLVLNETLQYGEPTIDRQSPGPDGRYCPMGFHWCWQAVDPADCDRIAGTLPVFGEHREYVMAVHQPLRMPHDRLAVTRVYPSPPGDRLADAAAMALDGNPIGAVARTRDGAVKFLPLGRTFTPTDLEGFGRDCRWRGREVDTATVVQALIAEYQATTAIAGAAAGGMAAVVLRDGDGHIVSTDYRLGRRPFAPGDRQPLAKLFTGREAARRPNQHQFVWQVWTGRQWLLLDIVDVPGDTAPTAPYGPDTDQVSSTSGSAVHPAETTPPHPAGPGLPETGDTDPREDQ